MREKLISVVVPCYNASQYLDDTILSLAGQTRRPDQVIIVDDASVDDTRRKAIDLCKYGRLKYQIIEHETNEGIGASRQDGAFAAKGDFVAFLSSDDAYHPRFIEACLPFLDANHATFTSYYRCNENLEARTLFNPPWFDSYEGFRAMTIYWALQKNMFVNFSTIILPRRYFTKIEFKTELRHGEDLIFLLDSIIAQQRWICIREPLLAYRIHKKQGTHIRDHDEWKLLWKLLKERLLVLGVPKAMIQAAFLGNLAAINAYEKPYKKVLRRIKSMMP